MVKVTNYIFIKLFRAHTKFTVDHYNELLRVYIANNRGLKVDSFIQQMAPLKPNIITYELILRALGEVWQFIVYLLYWKISLNLKNNK